MTNPRPPKIGTEEIDDFLSRLDDGGDWDDWLDIDHHPVIVWLRAIEQAQPWGVEIRAVTGSEIST